MEFPSDLKYTKEHEWVKIEGDHILIGITDFAQKELGDIVYVEVDTVEEHLGCDEVFGSIEAVKTVSDLFLPVSGTIIALNEILEATPESINEQPYESWIIKVKPDDMESIEELLDSNNYKSMIGA